MNQSLLDASEAVLRVQFVAIHCHLKKQKKKSQINNLTLHLNYQLEKKEQRKSKVSRIKA